MELKTILIVIRVGSVEDETGKESFAKEAMSFSKTLKHLRYKGNTIIEKGATFAIKNKNTSK